MRLVFVAAAALAVLAAAPALAAPRALALNPADSNHDGVVSADEASAWLGKDRGEIIPIRMTLAARASGAATLRRTMFDPGLLRPNDFRTPAPEDRPAEELFYKDFRKLKK